MRGGEHPLNKQIRNLKKSISYLSNRISKHEYRKQVATNSAQIEKQTKELQLLEQQKQRAINNAARIAAENATKKRVLAEKEAAAARMKKIENNSKVRAEKYAANKAKANAEAAENAAAKKRAINNAAENARLAAINAATPNPGLMDTLKSAVGLNPANANKAKLDGLVVEARELAQKLTAAANAINATKKGGKHRNRRTRRK